MNTLRSAPFPIAPGRHGAATIALLTITDEEFEIVQKAFGLFQNISGTPYFVASSNDKHHKLVIRRAPSQTNPISQKCTDAIIEDFRPAFVFLIGTAGGHSGRDGTILGDVVVATYINNSNYIKFHRGQVLPRRIANDHPSLHLLDRFVEPLRVNPDAWRKHIKKKRPEGREKQPKILFGEIASGDVLYGDSRRAQQIEIIRVFDKALAFEMEGWGVGRAIYAARHCLYYNPQYLVIRGISDYVDRDPGANNTTRKKWTPYAIEAATSVAMAIIERVLDGFHAQRTALFSFNRSIKRQYNVRRTIKKTS